MCTPTVAAVRPVRSDLNEPVRLKKIDETELYELLPILDAFNEPEDLADCHADFKAMAEVFTQLARYASVKKCATQLRLKGNIAAAQVFEQRCGKIYKSLPEWARW